MNDFFKYSIAYSELTINPHKTASMLGYKKTLPDDILPIVEEVMYETSGCFEICCGYQIFDNVSFVDDNLQISVSGIDFFPNKIVYHQLEDSQQIAVFVCTSGDGISQFEQQMMASNEPLKGYIANVLGSVVTETAVDVMQNKLSESMAQKGFKNTNRYSPGYCGWHTHEQHKLFSLLPGDNCGIKLTKSALMQPIKSVSGFIGIGKNVRFNKYTCKDCDLKHCMYKTFNN